MDSLPGADDGRMYLPIGVDRYRWFAHADRPAAQPCARASRRSGRGDMLVIDIRIESAEGAPVAQIDGLRCRRASRDMFRRRADAQVADWLYAPAWKVRAPARRRPRDRRAAGWYSTRARDAASGWPPRSRAAAAAPRG